MNSTEQLKYSSQVEETAWYAVRTRFKSEKLVCSNLNKKGIFTWLPTMIHVRNYSRKIRKVELPLISCYVFVQLNLKDRIKVLETENVVGFIQFDKKPVAIPEQEINTLRRVCGESNLSMDIYEGVWSEGEWVEIVEGSLAGLKGRLVDIQGKSKVLVALEQIGHTLHLQIEKRALRKV